jgi:hypothetical protein
MIGMRILAPPSPVREPTKPTGMEIKRRENMSRATVTPARMAEALVGGKALKGETDEIQKEDVE